MMDFKRFNETAELVGIVAIVASLVFVGLQLRQSQRIALAELEGTFATAAIETASVIGDNQDIWHRGMAGEELTSSEAPVFSEIVTAVSNKNWAMYSMYKLLDDDVSAQLVAHEFAAYLHARPGARRIWVEHEAELKKTRSLLAPGHAEMFSPYVETIRNDLATLDQDDG